ncbi:TetR/AcrR family transcriptional regulator [Desulfitobacterium sp. THU1]|uniref:TetR/AcrR family transcriptional regulator n=1 Tax=Desulfitobacterium sp. THU1 TaxID=3138072 RepID=UPI00311F098F
MAISQEDKYEKILDAAIEAFAEVGYHSCQVAKIARMAGVADGTIYLYFKNKEDILVRLFTERMGRFIELIRSEMDSCQNTRSRLRAIVHTHLTYMENNRALATVSQIELRQPNSSLYSAIAFPLRDYFRLIEEVIEEGIKQKEIIPSLNVHVARQMIFGTIDRATTDWFFARSERSLSKDTDCMIELFAGALGLPKEENIK